MREAEVSTPVPSGSPENSPSANFAAAAPSSPSVPCFLSLTRGPLLSAPLLQGNQSWAAPF